MQIKTILQIVTFGSLCIICVILFYLGLTKSDKNKKTKKSTKLSKPESQHTVAKKPNEKTIVHTPIEESKNKKPVAHARKVAQPRKEPVPNNPEEHPQKKRIPDIAEENPRKKILPYNPEVRPRKEPVPYNPEVRPRRDSIPHNPEERLRRETIPYNPEVRPRRDSIHHNPEERLRRDFIPHNPEERLRRETIPYIPEERPRKKHVPYIPEERPRRNTPPYIPEEVPWNEPIPYDLEEPPQKKTTRHAAKMQPNFDSYDCFCEEYAKAIFEDDQGQADKNDVDDFITLQKACQSGVLVNSLDVQFSKQKEKLTGDFKEKIIKQNLKMFAFLAGNGPCVTFVNGKFLTRVELLKQNTKFYDQKHDFIQWVFPLNVPSRFVGTENTLISELLISLKPLNIRTKIKEVIKNFADHFHKYFVVKINAWSIKPSDHLNARISRMITCLRLFNIDSAYVKRKYEYYLNVFQENNRGEQGAKRIVYLQQAFNTVPILN